MPRKWLGIQSSASLQFIVLFVYRLHPTVLEIRPIFGWAVIVLQVQITSF